MHETKERFGDFFSMAAHQATQPQNFTPMQLEGDVFIEAFLAQSVYLQNDFTCFGAFIIIRMIELGDVAANHLVNQFLFGDFVCVVCANLAAVAQYGYPVRQVKNLLHAVRNIQNRSSPLF